MVEMSTFEICTQQRVLRFFEKISDDPNDFNYKCLITEKCTKPLSGKKTSNLVAHAKTHKEFFKDNFGVEAKEKLSLAVERLHFIQCCAEIVTINGQPLSALNKSGFRKLYASKLQRFKDADCGDLLGRNLEAVTEHIKYLTSELIEEIKAETKNKFLSVLIDIASKYRRSILGINVQYFIGNVPVTRTIGMTHLTSSHTAKYIADKMDDQLNLFDIKMPQVITITADNARNMTAMIDHCNEMFGVESNLDESDDCSDEGETVDCPNNAAIEDEIHRAFQQQFNLMSDEDIEKLINGITNEMETEENERGEAPIEDDDIDPESLLRDLQELCTDKTLNINGIRCAAHTLQLAVLYALKMHDYSLLIMLCRAASKELRIRQSSRICEKTI